MMPDAKSSAIPLPAAMRDTALTITALAGHAAPLSFVSFRQKGREQIKRLRAELVASGLPADVIEDAVYAQCALLDEVALGRLGGADRHAWENEPLQVLEFQSHDAGEQLIARIERRLAQVPLQQNLLVIFRAVLDLGFKGKFALDGIDARLTLMQTLDERLGRHHEPIDVSAPILVIQDGTNRWQQRWSAPAWFVIACIAAGAVYIGLNHWLAASLAQLAP